MKRLTAILMIALMLVSVTSCKEMPEDSVGVSEPAHADIADNTESGTVDTDKTDTKATDSSASDTEKNETETDTEPKIDEPEEDFTLDVPFSEYEVVVTLTDEETAKQKTYTPEDFPELDVFNVFENPDYYRYKHDFNVNIYNDKTTLILMLSEPSKERVLEYIKILEKDARVFDATPSLDEFSTTEFYIKMKNSRLDYTADSFDYLDLGEFEFGEVYFGTPTNYPNFYYSLSEQDGPFYKIYYKNKISEEKLIEEFKKLKNDTDVQYIVPYYGDVLYICDELIIKPNSTNNKEKPLEENILTDYPELKIKQIIAYDSDSFVIKFDADTRQLFNIYRVLSKDNRIESIKYNTACYYIG